MWMSAFYFGSGGSSGGPVNAPGAGLEVVISDDTLQGVIGSPTTEAVMETTTLMATIQSPEIQVVLPDDVIAAITDGLSA